MDPNHIADLVSRAGLTIVEQHLVPGGAARYRELPEGLHRSVMARLDELCLSGVYAHQVLAIEHAIAGEDVCVATPTASGKSVAFMAAAAHEVLMNRSARVLVLYPMKALIRDQLGKWEEFLCPLGLRVGFIDGSVPVAKRGAVLASSHVVAMTPDVAHAWLMSHLTDGDITLFTRALRLLVLDEAHVYDGVFGTNMAYLLRRLAVVAGPHRIIASTATIGEPERFMEQLTGRSMIVLGAGADGSARYDKFLLLAKVDPKGSFEAAVKLLSALTATEAAHFLAFADSRKAVERITAATHRHGKPTADDADMPPDGAERDRVPTERILPYRAGYEEEDRRRIQEALSRGALAGVVSTNALELGLDIGDIDVVVLMNSPPSVQAFHQRIGRAGRRRPAVCVVIDDLARIDSLEAYLRREPEPGWVYLENRYIQYSQALCASAELQELGSVDVLQAAYRGLPESFVRFVENELMPKHGVDDDLFALKQHGQADPHHQFPIRNAAEQNFNVLVPHGARLGSVTYAQLLREAYPGAVYYYLARPYRVLRVDHGRREVFARRDRFFTTQPNAQATVFANFQGGLLQALRSERGFVVEADLQVSERVTGFTELRGKNRTPHKYGPGSNFSQRPLTRYFRTTGVCWAFPEAVTRSEALASRVMKAFSRTCGVLERDVGYGLFQANQGPFSTGAVQGMVVYDATYGSLRLTQRLLERLDDVLTAAVALDTPDAALAAELANLIGCVAELTPADSQLDAEPAVAGDWVEVVASGETAMLVDGADGAMQVTVLGSRYTPQGLMYELQHDRPGKWLVVARRVQPLPGATRTLRLNLTTGEEAAAA
jgi:DEAD/DEAH box helicase domain-containing protein